MKEQAMLTKPVTKYSLMLRMKERVMLSFQSRLRNIMSLVLKMKERVKAVYEIFPCIKVERTSYVNFAKPVTKYSLVLRMKERVMLTFPCRLRNFHLC